MRPGNPTKSLSPFGQAALSYAQRCWAVFPLGALSKVPLISKEHGGHGYHDATTDEVQIRESWSRWPRANVGIATRASGLVIIDVDSRKGGDERLLDLEGRYGKLPDTPEVVTGSGGRHVYFAAPETDDVQRKTDALGDGLDLPNYVVAPPSIHPDTGSPYVWEASSRPDDIPVAPCPAWVLKLAENRPSHRRQIYLPVNDNGVSWASILGPYGWVPVLQVGGVTRWRRPGKDDGWSASTDFILGRLFLFTTSGGPLEAGRPYDKVQAYAALNNLDYRQAARELGITRPVFHPPPWGKARPVPPLSELLAEGARR
jgi:hypothetical protein